MNGGAQATEGVLLRSVERSDGATLWRLARDSRGLDLNTPYCYLLAAEEWGETCVVAEEDGQRLGFVLAFRPPKRPDHVFVWQVAVSAEARGRGLAGRLLAALVRQPGCDGVRWLEATVTSSNEASRALFRAFARDHDAPCEVVPHFKAADFPETGHDAEELFRIGPFPGIWTP